ncbi:hypothetical protein AMST5_03003 [freshwater sediment metagenome]|uniref:Uncharacterized protein n=1 Tax=freshwater sediment metagenome TaxID=556182 RepID=A0AA48RE87_9ZZZZ
MSKIEGNDLSVEEWLAIRKEEGLKIDPETAEATFIWTHTVDPYGVHPNLPPESQQIGREYFARNKGSDIWVSRDDIPDEIWEKIVRKHRGQSASPVRLSGFEDFDEEESS